MRAHVQEGLYGLLGVKDSRADAGTISADLGPGAALVGTLQKVPPSVSVH